MAYLTGDLWKRRPPVESISAILTPEQAAAFTSSVFSVTEVSTREQFVLSVSAQDAAASIEQRKMELMTVNQLLMGY